LLFDYLYNKRTVNLNLLAPLLFTKVKHWWCQPRPNCLLSGKCSVSHSTEVTDIWTLWPDLQNIL